MTLLAMTFQIAAFGLGLALARRAAHRSPSISLESCLRESRSLWAIPLVLALLVSVPLAASVSDSVCQRLPLWLQRNATRTTGLLLGSVFAFLSGFAVLLAVRTRHPRRGRLTGSLVLMNLAFLVVHTGLNAGIADSLQHTETEDGVILQSSGVSCGAATLANVAARYGRALSEEEAARMLGTTILGTTPGELRYALARIGVGHRTLNREELGLAALPPPVILFVDHPAVGSEGHTVAYVGHLEAGYEILDPLVGRLLWPEARLREVWHGNGIACLDAP